MKLNDSSTNSTNTNFRAEREDNQGADDIHVGGIEAENDDVNPFPKLLMRRYELVLSPRTASSLCFSLRHIRSSSIGKLVSVRGMITRCSDVKPHCEVCAYSCDRCGFEIYQQVNGKNFNPIRVCPTKQCSNQAGNGNNTVHTQTRGSKVRRGQETQTIRTQKHTNIPANMRLHTNPLHHPISSPSTRRSSSRSCPTRCPSATSPAA